MHKYLPHKYLFLEAGIVSEIIGSILIFIIVLQVYPILVYLVLFDLTIFLSNFLIPGKQIH